MVADVFVVGSAAMALAYDATRVTRDVDSLFVPHGVVLEAAARGASFTEAAAAVRKAVAAIAATRAGRRKARPARAGDQRS